MKGIKSMAVLLLLAASIGMAGCGVQNAEGTGENATKANGGNQPTVQTKPAASEEEYPLTIKHLSGTTVLEARPKKIATPYIAFVDYLAVLDEYPISAQGVETIMSNFPSLSKRLAGKTIIDLGMEADMERLLSSGPDLILAADDMADQYEQLSKIAPTVVLPQAGDWRETLQEIARIIGKEQKADEVLAEFDRKSAEYKEKLAFRQNETVMFAMYSGKKQFVTWNDGRFDPFYKGLGLTPPPGLTSNIGQLTLEGLADLNPDHLFLINNWQTPVEGGVRNDLKDDGVWNSLNAVKQDQVYFLEDPSLPGPMALAKIDGIESIMKALAQ